jgi:hypothetical protein
LSVKLPKDNVLAPQYREAFAQAMTQIDDLLAREGAPTQVAAAKTP